jgi:glycogen operon protein
MALTVELREAGLLVHLIFSAYDKALGFELPPLSGGARANVWRRWIDTSLPSPNDITPMDQAPPISGTTYAVGPRSVVVLIADSERKPSS